MKILIADDHIVVRKGLIQIISSEFLSSEIIETANGKEALEKLRSEEFSIAILDISMPEMSGLEVVRQVKIEKIKTPILILTSHPEEQYAIRVIKAGAHGFIGKELAVDELCKAIRKIQTGKKYISETLAEKLAGNLIDDNTKALHEQLSNREFEVFKLIGVGKTITEIAEILFLSVPTVSTYKSRILEKMHLKNTAELMHYAITKKIV